GRGDRPRARVRGGPRAAPRRVRDGRGAGRRGRSAPRPSRAGRRVPRARGARLGRGRGRPERLPAGRRYAPAFRYVSETTPLPNVFESASSSGISPIVRTAPPARTHRRGPMSSGHRSGLTGDDCERTAVLARGPGVVGEPTGR